MKLQKGNGVFDTQTHQYIETAEVNMDKLRFHRWRAKNVLPRTYLVNEKEVVRFLDENDDRIWTES